MSGPISNALVADHRRIEQLLDDARGGSRASYDDLRGALLRHIGIEEKILLPALRARGVELPSALQLRLDHSAIVAMLVPPPSTELLDRVKALLSLHDPIEEGAGGIYELADERLDDIAEVLARIERAPIPPLAPNNDGPRAHAAIATLLARAMEGRAGA